MSTYYAFLAALKNKNEEECLACLSAHPSMTVSEKRQAVRLCLQHNLTSVLEKMIERTLFCAVWNSEMAFSLLDEWCKGEDRLFKYALKSLPSPNAFCSNSSRFQDVFVEDLFNRVQEFKDTSSFSKSSFILMLMSDPLIAQHAQRVSASMLIHFVPLWEAPQAPNLELRQSWKMFLDTIRPDEMVRLAEVVDYAARSVLKNVRTQILEETLDHLASKSEAWWEEMLRLDEQKAFPIKCPTWHMRLEKKGMEVVTQTNPDAAERLKTSKRKI